MNFLVFVSVAVLSLGFIYLAFRFGSSAYYRSKKEYHDWVHKKGETHE